MKYTESQIYDIILSLIASHPNHYILILKKKYPDIVEFLINRYPLLNGHSLPEYCYWFLNNLKDFPECANEKCHNKLSKFRNVKTGYLCYCSSKCNATSENTRKLYAQTCVEKYGTACPMKNESVKAKNRNTCFEKYGVEFSFQADSVKEKTKNTCREKYGTDYAIQAKEVREKINSTVLERYGIQCVTQVDEFKAKAKQTNLKKYSVDNVAKSKKIQEKTKQTNLRRYGVECVLQLEEVKDKIKHTNIEKYGVPCVLQSPEIRDKIRSIIFDKYGVKNVFQSEEIKEKIKRTNLERYGTENMFLSQMTRDKNIRSRRMSAYYKCVFTDYDTPEFDINYFADNYSHDFLFKFKCRKCGNVFDSAHYDGVHDRCPVCYPRNVGSIPEKDIAEFVRQYADIRERARDVIAPLELDIYIPTKNIAIEFDGLYWHSDVCNKQRSYHVNKTNSCEKAGVRLIHIFENEWNLKRNIVKSRIRNMLGSYGRTIYARKCEIKEIDSKTSVDFQNANHIQGAINASVRLGLYFENELIALMTFGKCRFDKKHEWELLRFCCKLNYNIPGAASKLLKYFEITYKPKSIISYADRRWSQGKLYASIGFTLTHVSPPDYWYWKGSEFSHRSRYQKHKLAKLLPVFDPSKTEVENMKANGYFRIFDCGNMVFEKTY